MNVSYVVIIYVSSLFVLSLAGDDGKPIQKRILKLKNVNFNKTDGKPKSTKKTQKNKTIFVLSNPVIYPQKLFSPKPSETVIQKPNSQFDFLNFDAYILKPRNINYTALLSNAKSGVKEKELKLPEPTTDYAQNEFLDFARAEQLIQTTIVPTTLATITSTPYETTVQPYKAKPSETTVETATQKIDSIFPLGLAYFDSLRKYRKAFNSLKKQTKKPRIKTTTSTTTSTTATPTETEEPFIETTTARDYGYVDVTSNFDEDLYEEPHFESYRYKPRYHLNSDYDHDIEKDRYETTTRYLDYETLDRDNNHYESTEKITTTTEAPKNSARRKLKNNNSHSSNVRSNNFLYDRYINYPEGDESRRVVYVARPDNYKDKRSVRNKSQSINERRSGGTGGSRGTERTEGDGKKHKNTIPMQRHYFQ